MILVIPAKAGIQGRSTTPGPSLRWDDGLRHSLHLAKAGLFLFFETYFYETAFYIHRKTPYLTYYLAHR